MKIRRFKPRKINLSFLAMENATNQGTPPKNYMVESILVTIFCCLPFGIVGIINAANVNSRFTSGDVEGAQKASQEARKWMRIGFIIGLVVAVLYGIMMVLGVGLGMSQGM